MKNQKKASELVSIIKMGELTLVDAMLFQEVLARSDRDIPTLASSLSQLPFKISFANAWEKILRKNYVPIFKMALDLINAIPASPGVEDALKVLAIEAQKIASSRALLRHDLMGRIYHRLLMSDIAKYQATYYTSVPAAYLLARFSLDAPNDHWRFEWANVDSIANFGAGDLACGSGTLLSAAYSAILDKHVTTSAEHDLEAHPKELHKVLLEKVFLGLDVLGFAAHLSAVTLALHNPSSIFGTTKIYALPLTAEGTKPRLGSVDLLESKQLTPAIALTGEIVAAPEKKGISVAELSPLTVEDLDLVIMNPPFTRSMGGNLLFGALPKAQRRQLQSHLSKLLNKRKLSGIGQAGLGAVFIAVADRCLHNGGRLALVIPRTLLSGLAWRKARELLLDKYNIELIITSHQAPNDWNFSENTSLSEILLVARKRAEDADEPRVRTIVANLWRKPRNEMESIVVSGKFVELSKTLATHTSAYDVLENANASHQDLMIGEEKLGEAYAVSPSTLADSVDTWGQLAPFAQTALNRITHFFVTTGQFRVPGETSLLSFSTISLEEIADKIGSDRPHRMKEFRKVQHKTSYPALWGHDSAIMKTLATAPNAWMEVNPGKGQQATTLWARRGCLMVAERLRLNTMRLMAVELSELALASEWWPVTLKPVLSSDGKALVSKEHENIQVLWLNTTPGVLSWLAFREDTEGPWVGLKSETLRLLPLLDVTKLTATQTRGLLHVFAQFGQQELPPLPIQFQQAVQKQGWRYEVDQETVKIVTGETKDLTPIYGILAREPIFSLKRLG